MNEQEAVRRLKERFPAIPLKESFTYGEMSIKTENEHLFDVLSFLKESGYAVLMDLTGVDYLEPKKSTKVVYWLHDPVDYRRIRISTRVERGGSLSSVVSVWPGADWYERELFDLFGVHFEGHPDLKRILMPDDWIGHPLLKDYKLTEESVEFKHGVSPPVPSAIIQLRSRKQKNLPPD